MVRFLGFGGFLVGISSVALVGCSAVQGVFPAETVTVTAAPSKVSEPAPGASVVERNSSAPATSTPAEEPNPPMGVFLAYADRLCGPSSEDLPELVGPGDGPDYVEVIQMVALWLDYTVELTNRYDDQTIRAVKRMQSDLGVDSDGQVGPITWNAVQQRVCPDWGRPVGGDSESEGGFYMPDFVGTVLGSATDFLWYEYGLPYATSYKVRQGSSCDSGEVAVVQQVVPSPGTWVPYEDSYEMVTIYAACE